MARMEDEMNIRTANVGSRAIDSVPSCYLARELQLGNRELYELMMG